MRPLLKIFMDKRAVSPVLSNLLLTIVAVAAMSVATVTTYIVTANLVENMSERFIIEDVWFNKMGSTNRISIYVRNTGKNSITISAIYINYTPQYLSNVKLDPETPRWLNVTYDWTPGSLYYINVVTSRGNNVQGYYEAPS